MAGRPEQRRTAQFGQVDDRRRFDDGGVEALEQAGRRQHRAAGGDQVVDQQHALARGGGVGMDFDRGIAVFELVFLGDGGKGQLALLAHRNEAPVQLVGDDAAENEAAGVDAGHEVDLGIHVTQHESLDEQAESAWVEEQRRDVAKLDAGAGPVGNGADALAQEGGVEQWIGGHHGGQSRFSG